MQTHIQQFDRRVPFLLLLFLSFTLPSGHYSLRDTSEEDEDINRSQFPDKFFFGTATSAYQIEGAFLEDGKTLNNWDVFNHRQGVNVDNGDIADDHYHRFLDDIDMISSLGVNAYRFSISWARVLPRGRFGEVNPAGVSFYNKLIDNLLFKGIEPFVTIYHHDFPQELEDRYGSWLSHEMQEDFVHFAEVCFRNFGDRVKYWITINEPNLFTDMAYIRGNYPPAHCSEPFGNCAMGNSDLEPLLVMHNMLLAHARTVKIYRGKYQSKQQGVIGIVASAFMYKPLNDSSEIDQEAADRALAFNVAWVFDPLVYGDYPPEMRRYLGTELPTFTQEEAAYIKGSTDFIGINHYSTFYTKDCIFSRCRLGGDRAIRGFVYTTTEREGVPIGNPTGMERFFVVPKGMEEISDYVKERYHNMPIYVLENGYSPPRNKHVQVQETLFDVERVEFHKAYLASLARAIRNGADVRGYFVWSLMDNYEWVAGYDLTFGLYYVDHQTLKRIPKLSAIWFSSFLSTNSSHKTKDVKRRYSHSANRSVSVM